MRNAYEPLPPHFSRPFTSLINTLLRADPHDRPTTQVRLLVYCFCMITHRLGDLICWVCVL